jgi:glycosyltransferase involved in cell wall biosynthesis
VTARILVAHPFPDVYGADRVLLDAVTALRDAGMAPTVVLPEPGPMTAWLDERSLPYRCVDTPVMRKALLRPAGLVDLAWKARLHFATVAQTVAAVQADLVYVNTITLPHWVLGARRARVPAVVHVHESDERLHPAIGAALVAPLLAADRIIAVSNAAKAFLTRTVPRLRDRTLVVYNGVPLPDGDFPAPLAGSTARLAVIGRLNANKGQDLAIAAVQSLVSEGRDVRLEVAGNTFAGAEAYERSLHRSVSERGLGDRVTFTGFCDDVWGLLRRTDVVLAPSRTDSLPLVVIEAMLAARPVLAADVGGMRELIQDGHTGLLIEREDVAGLTARLASLLDDPQNARRLGANARVTAADRFGSERFRQQIVERVEAVLASPSRRRRRK